MPRLPRLDALGVAQHIIQRGNNRQLCFGAEDDFYAYISWLKEYADKYNVKIHAWVLMTNHVHILATPYERSGVSKMMQSLGRKYVQYFNYQYQRSGTLWEGRFRSCLVDSEKYVLECYRYIELNPVRAKMVENPKDYRWSSYSINATGKDSKFCSPHESYLALGSHTLERLKSYREFFKGQVHPEVIDDIRRATKTGLVVGSESFKQQLSQLLDRRVDHLARGRPLKNRL